MRDPSIWDRAVAVFHAPPGDDAKVFINRDYHPGNVLFRRGETPAEGVAREAAEETGITVEIQELVGVYDSRFCETRSTLQLYQFVFLCRPVTTGPPTTPHEVSDQRWFARDERPVLSPGHTIRVPHVFDYLARRQPFFDPLGRLNPLRPAPRRWRNPPE